MLLTITTTHTPATDLGYLLHKNPARVQSFPLSFGKAHVFYPEATAERCTAALLLDVDPVGLVRRPHGGRRGDGAALEQYVNDRPYVGLVVPQRGHRPGLRQRPGRAQPGPAGAGGAALPLEATLAVLPCRGGEASCAGCSSRSATRSRRRGTRWTSSSRRGGRAATSPSPCARLAPLQRLLSHLYVLVPVLDDEKHYWVGEEEVEKLLRHGEGWLATHPEREQIARRYLRHQARLTRAALGRLVEEDAPDPDGAQDAHAAEEAAVERRIGLDEQRRRAVLDALQGQRGAAGDRPRLRRREAPAGPAERPLVRGGGRDGRLPRAPWPWPSSAWASTAGRAGCASSRAR